MIDTDAVVQGFKRAGLSAIVRPVTTLAEQVRVDLQRPGSPLVFEQTLDLVEVARWGSLEAAVDAAAWRVNRALETDGGSV